MVFHDKEIEWALLSLLTLIFQRWKNFTVQKKRERERELKRGIIATLFLRDVECSVEELSRGRSTYFYVSALFTIQI